MTPDARVTDERLRERVFGTGDSLRDADWIIALGHAAKEVEPGIDYVPCVPDPQVIAGWLRALRELSRLRAQGQAGGKCDADITRLLKFYNVSTVEEVVLIQALRIDRLISKLPPARDEQPRNYREG